MQTEVWGMTSQIIRDFSFGICKDIYAVLNDTGYVAALYR